MEYRRPRAYRLGVSGREPRSNQVELSCINESFCSNVPATSNEAAMDGSQGSHLERQKPKFKEMDALNVSVRISPDVARNFARLEAFVHDSPHFDSGLLVNLQSLASGKSPPLAEIIPEMAQLARETMQHVQATGDIRPSRRMSITC
jgi:hypothetical protein